MHGYRDLLDHVEDYCGADVTVEADRFSRRAVQAAFRDFAGRHSWTYYYQRGRVATQPSYNAGTVQYTASTNQLVLTGGAWPSWVLYGSVVIANVIYTPLALLNATTLTLSLSTQPGADIAAGTAYLVYCDAYTLPADFQAADQLAAVGSNIAYPKYVHPRQWLLPQQLLQSPATPRLYTVMPDPILLNRLSMRFHPAPDSQYNFDFIYKRRPRPLAIDAYTTGTATATAASQTITGNGTSWSARLVGSLFRFAAPGSSQGQVPTGLSGGNPYDFEARITAVASLTSLTVDAPTAYAYAAAPYSITDPVDVEDGAMMTALLREVEHQTRLIRRMKPTPEEVADLKAALILAMEEDSRSLARRAAGEPIFRGYRMAYMPRGPDVS